MLDAGGQKVATDAVIVQAAETYITEADLQEAGGSQNYMLVAHDLE
jgi:hypothetical protein